MYTRVYEYWVSASPEEVWAFHSDPVALKAFTRPGFRVSILAGSGEPTEGQLVDMRVWLLGFIPVRWRARICQVTPPFGFTDQAEKSPFKFWRHRHDFIPESGGTRIREIVAYIVMGGKPGMAINKWFVRKSLDRLFAHRQKVMQERLGGTSSDSPHLEGTQDSR